MAQISSPARRVLGVKNPNAPLQQHAMKGITYGLEAASPNLHRPSPKRPSSPNKLALQSPRAGQKRKIEDLHEDSLADSQTPSSIHLLSQMTDDMSDIHAGLEETIHLTASQPTFALNEVSTSFRASQDEGSEIDGEFEIHEEPSQQTLDKMHAVTLTQHNSQLEPAVRPTLVQEGSQLSLSMSSLIDFDTNISSQDDDLQMMEEAESVKEQRARQQQDRRKEMLLEKAETLRTRLQLAFFKIQTNQISKPFARLQVPRARSVSPDFPAHSSSPMSSSTVRRANSIRRAAISMESRVAIARTRATKGPNRPIKSLSALPIPRIIPTAFSARWNDEMATHQEGQSGLRQVTNIPSSPPLSPAEEHAHPFPSGSTMRLVVEPRTPIRMPSHAARQTEGELDQAAEIMWTRRRPGTITSSVVKGEAANSLLQLVRGDGARSGGMGMCGL